VLSAVDLQLFILERPAAKYGWSNYDQMGVGIIATTSVLRLPDPQSPAKARTQAVLLQK